MSRDELIRSDKTITTLEYFSAADNKGVRSFLAFWWFAGYHEGPCWFCQCFRTDPEKFKRQGRIGGRYREIDHA